MLVLVQASKRQKKEIKLGNIQEWMGLLLMKLKQLLYMHQEVWTSCWIAWHCG